MRSIAPGWGIAPILKSNAYGHGLLLVAGILKDVPGIAFLGVDSYFEAEQICQVGINKKVVVLGYTPIDVIKKNRLRNVSFSVFSVEDLRILIEEKIYQNIHIKFDTGMHRNGISLADVEEIITLISANSHFSLEGIFSHFADAEVPSSKITEIQIARWNKLATRVRDAFPSIPYIHLANSAGFAYADRVVANVGRTGIALYGINPGNLSIHLRPALKMISVITGVRVIEAGERVGYNGTFVATRTTRVATVPVGYFEGVDRRLSGKGFFLVQGKTVPLCGRVSMNVSSCDVSGVNSVQTGSPVTVISNKSEDLNSVENISKLCDAISYEVLVRIPAHLRREIVP